MNLDFEILNQLTHKQRVEFDNDMQSIYLECHKQLNGKLDKLKGVSVNLNLSDEVYLNVVCEYDNTTTQSETIKGKITHLHKYKNRDEYDIALAAARASLN